MKIILCFKNGLLFIALNKMASFFEGQTSRAERLRKQQLYKNMLDEQLHYQNLNRDSQTSGNKFTLNKSRLSQPYDHYASKNAYQPPKRFSYSRNSPTPKTRIHTQPEQGAQKYLQSCEQIIKNLKSLTQKRKQKQLELLRLQSKLKPDYRYKKQEEDQVSRYLRSRNSDSLYKNQDQQDKKRQKFLLKPLKINDPLSKSTQYGKSVKVNPSKRKLKKIQPLQKSHRSYSSRSGSKSKEKQPIQEAKIMNPQQKQVYDAMIELMKYFKAKQEQIEKQKKKPKLISSQVQVDPILDKEPIDKKRQQSNESALKLKALLKLRQLNLKSREFVEKLKKAKEDEHQSKPQQKKSQPKKQHRLKKRLEDEIANEKKQQEQNKKAKQQKQNEQLLKAIANQLNKQEQQNESLTYCLRQLSRFLKDQNQEIQILKESQIEASKKILAQNKKKPQNNNKLKSNQPPKFRAEEFPKVKKNPPLSPKQKQEEQKSKVQHTKQQQDKLKEAFLKKLKKLRLRGKQFNDKIQSYKKQHQSQNSQYQQQQQRNPSQYQQQQRNPQMESQSPRDMKLTKQQA